jgi:hypothetical protein
MKSILLVLGTLALASVALAAPLAAPVITVGASNIKQLQFDWPSVPGASRYELWYLVGPGGQWVKYLETAGHGPIIRINVSVHLLDWRTARYRVAACNASGCTNSAAVGVQGLALDAVGYLKQNFDGEGTWFGQSVAMSADGMTAAVATAYAAGRNATNGVVYVYRKTSPSAAWRFEARLMPSLFRSSSSQPYSYSDALAVNGDGTLIAFGRPEGIGGQSFNGAVYLFRRNGTTWTQEKRLASGIEEDHFGESVDLDDSGNTLTIWHRGLNLNPGGTSGVTEIYNHTSAGWQLMATVPVAAGGYSSCRAQALSGDGKTLFRTCFFVDHEVVLVHNAPGWAQSARINAGDNTEVDTNSDGTLFVARRGASFADVYRLQQNVWSPDIDSPLNTGGDQAVNTHLFTDIAMSRDGKFIAVGDGEDRRGTVGPNYPPIAEDASGSAGSVYVFERKTVGWRLRRLMKPSVADNSSFGLTLALSANGHNMIVGAVDEQSGATGMHGDPADTSTPQNRGAAWLY